MASLPGSGRRRRRLDARAGSPRDSALSALAVGLTFLLLALPASFATPELAGDTAGAMDTAGSTAAGTVAEASVAAGSSAASRSVALIGSAVWLHVASPAGEARAHESPQSGPQHRGGSEASHSHASARASRAKATRRAHEHIAHLLHMIQAGRISAPTTAPPAARI